MKLKIIEGRLQLCTLQIQIGLTMFNKKITPKAQNFYFYPRNKHNWCTTTIFVTAWTYVTVVTLKIIYVSRWYAVCFDNLLRDVSTFTSRFIERGISSILIDHAKQICFVSIHLWNKKQCNVWKSWWILKFTRLFVQQLKQVAHVIKSCRLMRHK